MTVSRLRMRLRRAVGMLRWRDLSVARERCTLCRFPFLVRLADTGLGVRCPACGASAITLSLADVVRQLDIELAASHVYELSAQGPLVGWLRRHAGRLTTSEYLNGVATGAIELGIRCEDVQKLSFADVQFDLCTSTEVFEHVEDDSAGFRELRRVLRPGGWLVFSVPIDPSGTTVERTAIDPSGQRVNVLPPEYHGDRYRGDAVFTFRNYGGDIVQRLLLAGFAQARIAWPRQRLFGHQHAIVVARKSEA